MLTSPVEGVVQHIHLHKRRKLVFTYCDHMITDWRPVGWSDLHYRETEWEKERKMRDRGWERERCCAGEKLNQWLNYCMIAHSPKTWASFGRKCLIIGFRPCQTHAIPPTNGSVWKNWASWVREGQKIARRQKAPYALLLFFPSDKRGNKRERERHREGEGWQEGESVYVSEEEMKWQ